MNTPTWSIPGRYWEIWDKLPTDENNLRMGLDFRLPQYRREVFLDFYEFHTIHKTHPGCVYLIIPYLHAMLEWGAEEALWYCFINGCTQNPVTSLLIFLEFPDFRCDLTKLDHWFKQNYKRLEFDTDRRYHKKDFVRCVKTYQRLCANGSQWDTFYGWVIHKSPQASFRALWKIVNKHFYTFGRLSAFSYLEYLKIAGLNIECDNLFLEDMDGSRSHRNGLCKVLGRDDLDWHESNPNFPGVYTPKILSWLTSEAEALLHAAKKHVQDASYFTLESALCTYKSWHRPNRRYPNVYADMFHDRIKRAEKVWGYDSKDANDVLKKLGVVSPFDIFWTMRKTLHPSLCLEKNPDDPGCVPLKQNWYRETGQVIMMDIMRDAYENDFCAKYNLYSPSRRS